jgi:hypothetical protein
MFAVAVAGVLASHQVTYLLLHHDPHDRHAELMRTGHDYLPFAAKFAIVLAVAGIITLAVRAVRRPLTPAAEDPVALAIRLWGIQAAVFVAVEVLERLTAGAPTGDLLAGVLPVGIAALGVSAFVGAALLRKLHRSIGAIATAILRRRRPATDRLPTGRPAPVARPLVTTLAGAAGTRGPPTLLPR